MLNKEYSEEQREEVRQVVDEIIDVFRKHEMTFYEMRGILARVSDRVFEIVELPSKENEPEHSGKSGLGQRCRVNYFTPNSLV